MFETFVSLLLSLSISAQGMMFPFSFWKTTAGSGSSILDATCNGTLTTDGDYKVCDYTTSGDSTFVINSGTGNLRFLVVAGGAAGGPGSGAPGGAGGMQELTLSYGPGTYNLHVGIGGAPTSGGAHGQNGANSFFDSTTSIGGGGGATTVQAAGNGGSGGGGKPQFPTPGTGTAGQGFAGGAGDATDGSNGGGGGCGAAGADGTAVDDGLGGTGCNTTIFGGAAVCLAGGGNMSGNGSSTCGGCSNISSSPAVANKGGGGCGKTSPGSNSDAGSNGRVTTRWKSQ